MREIHINFHAIVLKQEFVQYSYNIVFNKVSMYKEMYFISYIFEQPIHTIFIYLGV